MVYIIWTDSAIDDLRSIKDYAERMSPDTAERFCLEFLDALARLERFLARDKLYLSLAKRPFARFSSAATG